MTIEKMISKMKSKTSCGHDGLSNKVLKLIKHEISHPLSLLINKSLHTGIFPDSMKIAKVLPLYKKGDLHDVNMYRPISLLPVLSKVLEKVVNQQLFAYLNLHTLLTKSQFGFRPKMSTTHAIMSNIKYIEEAKYRKKKAMNIYLDLTKAFDSLDHTILIRKLEYYGVKNYELKWFTSYLTNRRQFVNCKGAISETPLHRNWSPTGKLSRTNLVSSVYK
jgi:hypothetical protein